jgi:allantoin racemase
VKTILVLEPVVVATAGMLAQDEAYLERIKGPDTIVKTVAPNAGPTSIETYYDEAQAVPGVLRLAEDNVDGCDAVVVNCFADPGVHALREILDVPVVGPAEASMALALQLGHRFAVISILANAGPWAERQARLLGVEDRLAAAVGIELGVLDLDEDVEETARSLIAAARDCVGKGADVIVLGCTGMFVAVDLMRAALEVPVIEPLAAAVGTAELLVSLGLRHTHGGTYLSPDRSKFVAQE